jgi:hypothetical protein
VIKVWAMATGLAATTLVVGVAVTGCGSNKSSSPSSTTSSSTSSASPSSAAPTSSGGAAQPSDYTNLLIKPTDIVVAGDTFAPMNPPAPNTPAGVHQGFANPSGSRVIKDDIYVYPDAAAAAQARDMTAQILTDPNMGVKGGAPTPVDVGTGGTMAIGTTQPDGAKSMASIMFTEGRVFVSIDFEGPANDPLPPDFVLDVARKQDAAVKAGLPA